MYSYAPEWYTAYVLECITPGKWDCGTCANFEERMKEHRTGNGGSKWTGRHGVRRVHRSFQVHRDASDRQERDLWFELAREHGPDNVRGWDVAICERHTDVAPLWLLKRVGWTPY